MAQQPFGPWPSFSFLTLYTVCRTPWKRHQPAARPLPTHRATQTQNKRIYSYPCLEWNSNPRSSKNVNFFLNYCKKTACSSRISYLHSPLNAVWSLDIIDLVSQVRASATILSLLCKKLSTTVLRNHSEYHKIGYVRSRVQTYLFSLWNRLEKMVNRPTGLPAILL
jgi:hypothetical protein